MALNYRVEYERYKRYYTAFAPLVKSPVFKAYFSLVASVVTVAIFLAFAIRPTVATIIGLQKEIEQKREFSQKLDAKINALSLLQVEYQQVLPDLPMVAEALPADPQLSKAIIQIETLAQNSGQDLKTLSVTKVDYFAEATTSATVKSFPISIEVTGSYENVNRLLLQLIALPRIFLASKISLGKEGTVIPVPDLDLNSLPVKLEVVGFYLPEADVTASKGGSKTL